MSIQNLTDVEALTAGIDIMTDRDLKATPPADAETMQQLGISKTNLDLPVRRWINRRFRKPAGKAVFPKGTFKTSTTWKQLVDKVTGA